MEVNEQTAAPVAQGQEQTTAPETPQSYDLDGISEFTFQGQKYTPEAFHKMVQEHKTFAEQVNEYKRDREFRENLDIDIEKVLERPALASQFKATYPREYHAVLDKLLKSSQATAQVSAAQNPQQQAQSALPKEFMDEFGKVKERLTFFEQRAYDAEVQAANAKIDAIVPPLLEKFPLAVEDQVYSKAEALLQSGQKLTEKAWERIVRESHELVQKRADQHYGAKLKKQIEDGQKAAGEGPGGGAPGQAPVRPKGLAGAHEAALEWAKSQKFG